MQALERVELQYEIKALVLVKQEIEKEGLLAHRIRQSNFEELMTSGELQKFKALRTK